MVSVGLIFMYKTVNKSSYGRETMENMGYLNLTYNEIRYWIE